MKAVDDGAAKRPGFRRRTCSRREDGAWADLMFRPDAEAAAASDASREAQMLDGQPMRDMDPESWRRERLEIAAHLMAQPELQPP